MEPEEIAEALGADVAIPVGPVNGPLDLLGLVAWWNRERGPKVRCIECGDYPTWIRSTQFAGVHHFCEECAEQEEDFGQSDPSYFIWLKIPRGGSYG